VTPPNSGAEAPATEQRMTTERRVASERRPVGLRVALARPGRSGPLTLTGQTLEIGRGGCSLLLDEELDPAAAGAGPGALLLRMGDREVVVLTGPPLLDDGPGRVVRLTVAPASDGRSTWNRLVDELERSGDRVAPNH